MPRITYVSPKCLDENPNKHKGVIERVTLDDDFSSCFNAGIMMVQTGMNLN